MPITLKDILGEADKLSTSLEEQKKARDALAAKEQERAAKEQADVREMQRNKDLVEGLMKQYPRAAITATGSGGFSVNPHEPDPLRALLFQEKQKNKMDKDVTDYSNRVEKTGIPRAATDIEQANKAIPGGIDSNAPLRSYGGFLNLKSAVPTALVSPLESIGIMPKGSAEERRALQRLYNTEIKNISGSAVSGSEEARNKIAQGTSIFGDPSLARQGAQQIKQSLVEQARNVQSGTTPDALKEYLTRGGTDFSSIIKGNEAMAGSKEDQILKAIQDLEAEKAKHIGK